MSWKIEVSPSGLNVAVNITKVLSQPFLTAFTGLANVLFTTPSSPTADVVDQFAGVGVSLGVQVNSMVGCFCFESGPWLDVGAGRATSLVTPFHSLFSTSRSTGWSCWEIYPNQI